MHVGCDRGGENRSREVDFAFTGTVQSAPSAHADYIIDAGESGRFEPVELEESFRENGIRVRVEAVRDSRPSVVMVGPVIRIIEIEKL
jgi:hypothetical protein